MGAQGAVLEFEASLLSVMLMSEDFEISLTPSLDVQAWAQSMIAWLPFQSCTTMIVTMHIAWTAAELYYTKAMVFAEIPLLVVLLERAFFLYFLFELMVRSLACGNKRKVLTDIWFVLDLTLVIAMVIEMYEVPRRDTGASVGPVGHI